MCSCFHLWGVPSTGSRVSGVAPSVGQGRQDSAHTGIDWTDSASLTQGQRPSLRGGPRSPGQWALSRSRLGTMVCTVPPPCAAGGGPQPSPAGPSGLQKASVPGAAGAHAHAEQRSERGKGNPDRGASLRLCRLPFPWQEISGPKATLMGIAGVESLRL